MMDLSVLSVCNFELAGYLCFIAEGTREIYTYWHPRSRHDALPIAPHRMQLVSRHWRITDGKGEVSVVDGEGVVGEQPVLRPGASHDYVSGCPLSTPHEIG